LEQVRTDLLKQRQVWFDGQPDSQSDRNGFPKLTTLLPAIAERQVDGLWDAIGSLLLLFKPDECVNYFAAAGYEPDKPATLWGAWPMPCATSPS